MFIAYLVVLFVGIMPAAIQSAGRGKSAANDADMLTFAATAHSAMGTWFTMAREYASPLVGVGDDSAATAADAQRLLNNHKDLHPSLVRAAQKAARRAPTSWADETDATADTGSMSIPQASPAPANGTDDDDGFTVVGKKGKPVRKAQQHRAAPQPQQHHAARAAQQRNNNTKPHNNGIHHSASPSNGAGAATPRTQPSPKLAAGNGSHTPNTLHSRKPSEYAQNISQNIMYKAHGTPTAADAGAATPRTQPSPKMSAAAGAGAASLPTQHHDDYQDLATELASLRAAYANDMDRILQHINALTQTVNTVQSQLAKVERAQHDKDFPPLGS